MEQMSEALALMRRALDLIDQSNDPYLAGPHLDLAIAKVEQGLSNGSSDKAPGSPGDELFH